MSKNIMETALAIRETARKLFEKEHQITAIAFAFAPEPENQMVIIPLNELMDDKGRVEYVLKGIGKEADGIIFISETWYVKAPLTTTKEDILGGYAAPSEHPLRQEMVMIVVETRYEGDKVWKAEIYRPVGEDPFLGEWEEWPLMSEGRFANFLGKEAT